MAQMTSPSFIYQMSFVVFFFFLDRLQSEVLELADEKEKTWVSRLLEHVFVNSLAIVHYL